MGISDFHEIFVTLLKKSMNACCHTLHNTKAIKSLVMLELITTFCKQNPYLKELNFPW